MSLPDPTAISSSSQLFTSNYALPQIRQIHKSIHAAVEDRSARLRTQVGARYRELLGTAETIVHMHDDAKAAVGGLSHVGFHCSRAAVGSKVTNLAKLRTSQEEDDAENLGLAARIKLLEACALEAQIHLRAPQTPSARERERLSASKLVNAAKILVLGRLLFKSFSDATSTCEVKSAVMAAWKALASQRRKLFRTVTLVLSDSDENLSRAEILKSLCAYSLAISAGARDVATHFLSVRGKAMASCFDTSEREGEKGTAEDVERCLRLYTRTISDSQRLLPSKLSDALERLTQIPVVDDSGVRSIEGLRLDVYEKWCNEEIRYFTPYIRHHDLSGEQAQQMLATWTRGGAHVILNGLLKTLDQMWDFRAVAQLRGRILQLWIYEGGKARDFDPGGMLNSLRELINTRLLSILASKVNELQLVSSEISGTLESWTEGVTEKIDSLWETDTMDMDLVGGALSLIQEVLSREYGRNAAVSKTLDCYSSWYRVIDEVAEVISRLKKTRWESSLEEIEDEETIEKRVRMLNKEDAELLEEKLNDGVASAHKDLERAIEDQWKVKSNSSNAGHMAMYFLRIIRDMRCQLPPQLESANNFCLALIPALHRVLVETVAASPMDELVANGLSKPATMGRGLWEGEPALPTWPSPWTFMFLRNLSHTMEQAGVDLWTVASLRQLKNHLNVQLAQVWLEALRTMQHSPEQQQTDDGGEDDRDGKAAAGEGDQQECENDKNDHVDSRGLGSETQRQELFIQWLFDISIIQRYTGSPSAGSSSSPSPSSFSSLDGLVKVEHCHIRGDTTR